MKHIIIITLLSSCLWMKVNAQPSWFSQPAADGPYTENPNYNNWQKQLSLSDNFNETKLDSSKWIAYDYGNCLYNGDSTIKGSYGGGSINTAANVLFNYDSLVPSQSDVLTLAVDPSNLTGLCINNTTHYGYSGYYTSASIESQPATNPNDPTTYYNYGYYEVNIKMPGWPDDSLSNNPTGQYSPSGYCGDGFHPSFWLVGGGGIDTNGMAIEVDGMCFNTEIDIEEPGGSQFTSADFVGGGFHSFKPNCWTGCSTDSGCGEIFCGTISPPPTHTNWYTPQNYQVATSRMPNTTPLNLAYHNYAVEFLSDRIIYYFDRQPYAWTLRDCPSVTASQISHAFNIINPVTGLPFAMSVQFGNGVDYAPGTNDTVGTMNRRPLNINFPHTPIPDGGTNQSTWQYQAEWDMSVDSFYYWQLNPAYCDTSFTVTDDSDLTYLINNLGVRQNITFDGSSGTINYPPDPTRDDITFRATNEIDIKPGFDAPEGSTLNLMITPCNH